LGHIVGTYFSAGKFHGYIYRNGAYSTLDDPLGTTETVPQGINNADQVVGYYLASTGAFRGFFVDAAFGLYAPIDDPLAGTSGGGAQGTYAQDINNAHQIVGYYVDSSNRYHGFLYANGSYTTLDVPSATLTRALGINDVGQIVGTYDNASGHHGFLYFNGVYTTIDDPQAGTMPGQGTYAASGIDNAGNIVGYYVDGSGNFHGFLETANPPPPAGTTADMILRHGADGKYEIYDIGNNALLAAYDLGQVGTTWQFVGLGGFFGNDTTDMMLRNSSSGGFEVYDISNNNITNAAFLGAIGLEWQVMGFGNFSSLGETDMMLRNMNTGGVEICDIRNNQITSVPFVGTVGLNWQIGGFGNFSSLGESDMVMRNTSTGGLEVYDIANNQITNAAFLGTVGLDWQIIGAGNFSSNPDESDLIMRNTTTGGLEVYDIANNQITGAAFLGTVGLDWQFAGIAPARRFRSRVAQRQHRRVRGVRHRQQSNHGSCQPGSGRLGLATRRLRRRSSDRQLRCGGAPRAGDGRLRWRQRGRERECCRGRHRCVTAAVFDGTAARLTIPAA
jgi:probable HAF family extracellular repeat protein